MEVGSRMEIGQKEMARISHHIRVSPSFSVIAIEIQSRAYSRSVRRSA